MTTLYNKRFKPKGYSKPQKARFDKVKKTEKEAATQFKPTYNSPFITYNQTDIKYNDIDNHDRS